jgi:GNAT superfamily N-acetyltransferase
MQTRPALAHELDLIYMLAFDSWSEGEPEQVYLTTCSNSKKYQQGRWFVLTIADDIRSALIYYVDLFRLPEGFYGIGSVATHPAHRHKGYASALVTRVCSSFNYGKVKGVYLHSDIGAEFYERLGFVAVRDHDSDGDSICMMRLFGNNKQLSKQQPEYF